MKILTKSAIALAVAAATSMPVYAQMADGAAPQVTGVSGRFRVAIICDDASDTCDQKDYGGRFRMVAEEELGNGNTVFGRYEFEVDASQGSIKVGDTQRVAYVGIKGGFGSLSLGSRWSPFYNVIASPSDYTKAFGGTWRNGAGYLRGPFRLNNGVFYSVGGFQGMVQINDANDAAAGVVDDDDIDRVELALTLGLGGWNVSLAGSDVKKAADEVIGLNVNGHAGPVRLSLSALDNGTDTGFLGQAQAPVGGGTLSLSLGEDDSAADNSMVALEYERGLGPNSAWFIGAENSDNNAGTDKTSYGIGLHYNFN